MIKKVFLLVLGTLILYSGYSQSKGKLFIIGGGERSNELMQELIKTSALSPKDYIAVLLMSTSVPEESYSVFFKQMSQLCTNPIAGFNFTHEEANDDRKRIDSVRNARLIYFVGGDQNRFMSVVLGTKLYRAVHDAFNNGATISGTSAGAAVMSQIMITGEEKDKGDKNSFREIKTDNVITSEGMGFITKAVIDQHFIKRSRYNRMLSVLGDHPDKMVIGIDESTAIIIEGDRVRVTGKNQVVVVNQPEKLKTFDGEKISFTDAKLSLYKPGDTFELK